MDDSVQDELQKQAPPAKRARLNNSANEAGNSTDPIATVLARGHDKEPDSNMNETPDLVTSPVVSDIPSQSSQINAAEVAAVDIPQEHADVTIAAKDSSNDDPHANKVSQTDSPPDVTEALWANLLGDDLTAIQATDTRVALPQIVDSEDHDMSNSGVDESIKTDGNLVKNLPPAESQDVEMKGNEPTEKEAEAAPLPFVDVPHDESGLPASALLDVNTDLMESQEAEFEADSSPIESSSDDSSDSSDSDSDEESEGDDTYKMLSVEEQARILMEGDGGSDDEGGGNKTSKGSGAQLRTKNEVPEEAIPKPDVVIMSEMNIEELGNVQSIVESMVLVNAKTSGEYRVLESGSVLCLADRSVIGVVAEIIGRVQQPLYMIRFTNAAEIAEAGLSIGTKVFYSEQHSTYVFTQPLKAFKGSDASNLHDEEVGDEEKEFSDDEAEAEHKRQLKQKKLARRGGREQQTGSRGDHPLKQEQKSYDSSVPLSYDEAEDEGPYKPLSRPASFATNANRAEAPEEIYGQQQRPHRGGRDDSGFRGRGRGDRGRGRGDRSRGGDRGRGRGGYQSRGDGYAQPAGRGSYNQTPSAPPTPQQFPPPLPGTFNYPPPMPQYPPQQFPGYPQQQYQQPYQQAAWQNPQHQQHPVPPPPMPAGAFFNPAFFGQQPPPHPQDPGVAELLRSLQHQQHQQGGRGRGS